MNLTDFSSNNYERCVFWASSFLLLYKVQYHLLFKKHSITFNLLSLFFFGESVQQVLNVLVTTPAPDVFIEQKKKNTCTIYLCWGGNEEIKNLRFLFQNTVCS